MMPRILANGRLWLLIGLCCLGLMSAAAGTVTAYSISVLFDTALGEPSMMQQPKLWYVTLPMAVLGLFLLQIVERVLAEQLGQHYLIELRTAIYDRLFALADDSRARLRQGHLMTRFSADLTAIRTWVARGLSSSVTGATMLLGLMIFLAFNNIIISIALGLATAFTLGLVLIIGPRLEEKIRFARQARARLSAFIGERITAMSAIRAIGSGKRAREQLMSHSDRVARALVECEAWMEATRVLPAIAGLLMPGLIVFVSIWLVPGGLTNEQLVLTMTIAGLGSRPLVQIAQAYAYLKNFRVARDMSRKLFALPLQPTESSKAEQLPAGPVDLAIDKLPLRAGLPPFSGRAESCSKIVISGSAGSGKSRLLRILAGFETAPKDKVLLNGYDLSRTSRESIHRAIALLAPNQPLIKGTLSRNLGLTKKTRGELQTLLQRSGVTPDLIAEDDVEAFRIREGGANIGASLHLRILLARVLALHPSLLLVDDYDQITDDIVRGQINKLWQDETIGMILVSNSPRLAATADNIWRFEYTPAAGLVMQTDRSTESPNHANALA